jgi:hypothetical protein
MNALYSAPKQNLLTSLSGLLQKASLPGMTRIAPNGLHVQNDKVEVGCFKPNLLNVIKAIEGHFGKPVSLHQATAIRNTTAWSAAPRNRCTRPATQPISRSTASRNGTSPAISGRCPTAAASAPTATRTRFISTPGKPRLELGLRRKAGIRDLGTRALSQPPHRGNAVSDIPLRAFAPSRLIHCRHNRISSTAPDPVIILKKIEIAACGIPKA